MADVLRKFKKKGKDLTKKELQRSGDPPATGKSTKSSREERS